MRMTLEEAQLKFLEDKALYAVRQAYKLGLKAGKKKAKG